MAFSSRESRYEFDDLTFEYTPDELGLEDEYAAKIKRIHQLRPLVSGQPWGIFFVEFENKKLPIVVLRRILSHLVLKQRKSANPADRARWNAGDLLFISAFAEEGTLQREIAFAHFHQDPGDQPTLRVLGWDGGDTPLKLEHVSQILKHRLSWPRNPTDHAAWRRQWAGAFRHSLGQQIRTADLLAQELARVARNIRDAAMALMKVESSRGPLRRMHEAFRIALIHDLTQEGFADTYAQTITYGLLTAAISRTDRAAGADGTFVLAEDVHNMVPITNPFLKEMLESFLKVGGRGTSMQPGLDFDELGVQEVVEMLRSSEIDLPAVLEDFGNRNPGEDPVIRFYEDFLKAYNKELKIKRGVFYTPQPVVSYIVRSVHELLRTEFALEDGLASTITWGEMATQMVASGRPFAIPPGTSPQSHFVVILDPATGTATFLVEVIDVIYRTLNEKWKAARLTSAQRKAEWNRYVPEHLLPRIFGYELMMAPYAIAHMKIGLKLHETSYAFASDERVRIFLTNALEAASDDTPQRAFEEWAPALAHEAAAVNAVKREQKFTVVLGNPPYAVNSSNVNAFIDALMDDYKKDVRTEVGLVALSDDYLKFMRLSQMLLSSAKVGIWSMITNRGYLKGIIHRGVRKELIGQFRELFVLDLHGDSNVGEQVPQNVANDNVFDIQQGVSIVTALMDTSRSFEPAVLHAELWGTRSEKYVGLLNQLINVDAWNRLRPYEPQYFLIPFNNANSAEYENGISLPDLMPIHSCGVKTHRDGVVIDFDKAALIDRMSKIANSSDLQALRDEYGIKDTPNWKLKDAKLKIKAADVSSFIHPITYRPFDSRWIYYNPAIIEKGDSKFPTLRHMLETNLGLISARIQVTGSANAMFVADCLVEMKTGESSRSCTIFPLYLVPDAKPKQRTLGVNGRVPNFNPDVLRKFSEGLGVLPADPFGLPTGLTPEDIIYYIYGVLHSPTYRTRYSEFLKIGFPRIPVARAISTFRSLSELGKKLVELHLMKVSEHSAESARYFGVQRPEVEKSSMRMEPSGLIARGDVVSRVFPKLLGSFTSEATKSVKNG